MIRERLEAGQGVKPGTKREHVLALLAVLVEELTSKLSRPYIWLASCTVAVEAGDWGGERRRKRRLKLRSMIQSCAAYAGVQDPTAGFEAGWETKNLIYGYDAMSKAQRLTGAPLETLCFVGLMASKAVRLR